MKGRVVLIQRPGIDGTGVVSGPGDTGAPVYRFWVTGDPGIRNPPVKYAEIDLRKIVGLYPMLLLTDPCEGSEGDVLFSATRVLWVEMEDGSHHLVIDMHRKTLSYVLRLFENHGIEAPQH